MGPDFDVVAHLRYVVKKRGDLAVIEPFDGEFVGAAVSGADAIE